MFVFARLTLELAAGNIKTYGEFSRRRLFFLDAARQKYPAEFNHGGRRVGLDPAGIFDMAMVFVDGVGVVPVDTAPLLWDRRSRTLKPTEYRQVKEIADDTPLEDVIWSVRILQRQSFGTRHVMSA
jgi:hypothetical protein